MTFDQNSPERLSSFMVDVHTEVRLPFSTSRNSSLMKTAYTGINILGMKRHMSHLTAPGFTENAVALEPAVLNLLRNS